MEDSIQSAIPVLALAGFALVLFTLVIWKRSSCVGGLGRRGMRNVILLGVILFVVLLPLVLITLPQRTIAENIGFALFVAIFLTGTSVAMWMGGT